MVTPILLTGHCATAAVVYERPIVVLPMQQEQQRVAASVRKGTYIIQAYCYFSKIFLPTTVKGSATSGNIDGALPPLSRFFFHLLVSSSSTSSLIFPPSCVTPTLKAPSFPELLSLLKRWTGWCFWSDSLASSCHYCDRLGCSFHWAH